MNLTIGERVSWRGLNREYTGEIEGFYGPFAIATIEVPIGKYSSIMEHY